MFRIQFPLSIPIVFNKYEQKAACFHVVVTFGGSVDRRGFDQ